MRLAGVRVWQVRITAYIAAGILGSIGGILLGGRTGAVRSPARQRIPAAVGGRGP